MHTADAWTRGVAATRRTATVVLVALLSHPAAAESAPRLQPVARGFTSAVAFVQDPLVPGAFHVVSQDGLVRVLVDGAARETPFLDLREAISRGGERGLLGLAFPPDAAGSGRVFVNFTDRNGHTVVARFVRRADDPLVAEPESRFDLEWPDGRRFIEQPYSNHNGGHLAFGPDGFLFIGLGDGGSGNDPQNRAQSPGTLLWKMLRIDVSVPADHSRGYVVPPDNPFVGRAGVLPEIWALGYRNPWRYGFDDVGEAATGALIVGDVGQNAREEIDHEPAGAGGRNYGWRHREGTIATPGVPPAPVDFGPLVEPLADYGRGRGQAVTGGYVYRGSLLPPAYHGRYFFGDYGSGRVWSLGLIVHPETREASLGDEIEHTDELGGSRPGLSSFGRDAAGELYIVTIEGEIFRIVSDDPPPESVEEGARQEPSRRPPGSQQQY
jgi:glucose/arabinose dehydrogenase